MPTANATLTTTYAKIADSGEWTMVSYARPGMDVRPRVDQLLIELVISEEAPAATLIGHILPPGKWMRPTDIGAGDLYGRVSVFSASTGRTQVICVSSDLVIEAT